MKLLYGSYTLEDCKLGTLRGKGSVGAVYEAKTPDGKQAAIKIMEENPFVESLMLETVIKGAIDTQKVADNANVVKVHSAGKSGNKYYIVMDLYNSGTLQKIISGDYTIKQKLKIAWSLAKTLAIVHKAGMLHGDLKPDNVLLDETMEPFLNDFYHSSLSEKHDSEFATPRGTPKYMSPEQALGRFLTPASDIYSFGVLFYELLTSKAPYKTEAQNISEMLTVIQKGEIVPACEINKQIDAKLEAVIMKFLAMHIPDRYANMNEAAADIKACLDDKEISIPYTKPLLKRIMEFFGK